MKAFSKFFLLALIFLGSMFLIADYAVVRFETKEDEGRPYRIEVNRLAREIEENGLEKVDRSKWNYVTEIEKESGSSAPSGPDFYNVDSDYIVRIIHGERYRFDYKQEEKTDKSGLLFLINTILAGVTIFVIGTLLFVQKRILQPFERLSEMPYELAKGNLTMPVKEEKNHFFGRFLWGIDLLRETMEQKKQQELSLQKEKKTLLLSLSHDIKTPLLAIQLYAKALSKGLYQDSKKQLEVADSIYAKAEEIGAYVSQMIRASREEVLSFEVHMGEFYLSELMEKIAAYYKEKLALLKTEFVVKDYSDCLLRGDLDRSVEVLQNIIENAVKYGDGNRISIETKEEDGCMLIAVQNTGCTLSDEEQPHLFESFWRGSNAKNIQGSGLGLYIARQLMVQMHGDIFAKAKHQTMEITVVFPMEGFTDLENPG